MIRTLHFNPREPIFWMLSLSVLLHGAVLSVHFSREAPRENRQAPPQLEVVLVNSSSATRPATPRALAQANLDGGGNTDAKLRAQSPVPHLEQIQAGEVAARETTVKALESQARSLLTTLHSQPVSAPLTAKPADGNSEGKQQPVQVPEMLRLRAEIEREWQAYQQRPRRRFVGASTQEYRLATYVEDWRTRVEHLGNLHYPDTIKRQGLHGRVTLTVSIYANGQLEKVQIDKSSGNRLIDEAAVRTVTLAAPFAAFPEDIRRETDILSITRTFIFTRENGLQSTS